MAWGPRGLVTRVLRVAIHVGLPRPRIGGTVAPVLEAALEDLRREVVPGRRRKGLGLVDVGVVKGVVEIANAQKDRRPAEAAPDDAEEQSRQQLTLVPTASSMFNAK